MSDARISDRPATWYEISPLGVLLSSLRLAFSFRALLLAALALAATVAGWRLAGAVYQRASDDSAFADYSVWPWDQQEVLSPRVPTPINDAQRGAKPAPALPLLSDGSKLSTLSEWIIDSPLFQSWRYLTEPVSNMFQKDMTFARFTYLLLCALWALAIWALFGGAVSRLTAVTIARDEQPSWGNLIGYARSKWVSYFFAPLFPLLGILLIAIPTLIVGLLMRSDVGALVGAILWPLVLLAGAVMAVLLLGLLFGWPLMWGTISAEGTDAFDALSRSYSYTFQRPLHYFFYAVVAAILGTLGWILVWIFATAILGLATWGVSLGSGSSRLAELLVLNSDDAAGWAGKLMRFWNTCVLMLAIGFALSYFWTATTAIYFLLRRDVDATELDEIYVREDQEAFGLPPLGRDAAGVPTADLGGGLPPGGVPPTPI